MPRRRTIRQSEFPYFISARCINREWFGIPMPELWSIFSDYLYLLHYGFNFKVHSFVTLNNHYHMIVSTPDANIDHGMNYFQREVSKCISRSQGRINQIFGGPYHPCVLDSHRYFLNAYKYLYRNPVKAGISERVEEYPYSTLYGLIGQAKLTIPLEDDTLLFNPGLDVAVLEWLNQANSEDFDEVHTALSKPRFRFQKNDDTGKPLREDDFVF